MESTKIPQNGVRLSAVPAHELVRIRKLEGGHTFVSRLASLGFTPGTPLRVIQNFGHGPLIVCVRDTRVALGRGEAEKVWVERVTGERDG